ncbi:MAG: 4-hydroxy-tetrahydrodipicolinate synthase [Bacillota bacterium]
MREVAFGSLLTAMVTPFNEDGEVNYKKAGALAEKLAREGSDAIVVGGTTGESPTLSREERSRLLDAVLEVVGHSLRVVAGTGTNCTRDSVELSKMAERAGAHGLMLVTPYYNKPPQGALVSHFKAVAESTGLPIMLYNVPGRTGVNMTPETVQKVSEIPNIIALKEAAGSLDQASEIAQGMPETFTLYSGDDSLTLPMLAVGASGVVSVASHVAGLEIKAMIQDYQAGRVAQARERHLRLFPLFKALFITTNPIPVKAALEIAGFRAGGVRLPLTAASGEQRETIRGAMLKAGVL